MDRRSLVFLLIDPAFGHGDLDGEVHIWFQFKGDNGLWTSTALQVVTLDRTTVATPTVTAPVRAISSGTTLPAGRLNVRLALTVSDPGFGIAHFDLERRIDTGAWSHGPLC